jgi:Rod binding domain-containing protein
MVRLEFKGIAPETAQGTTNERALRDKASEFEGMLIAQILQKLDECYKLGNSDDGDSAGQSFLSLATSAVGGGLARSGGVGIAGMIVQSLRRADLNDMETAGLKGIQADLKEIESQH